MRIVGKCGWSGPYTGPNRSTAVAIPRPAMARLNRPPADAPADEAVATEHDQFYTNRYVPVGKTPSGTNSYRGGTVSGGVPLASRRVP